MKSLITTRQYFVNLPSVQCVHSILSKTCQLFGYMFFVDYITNLMMILRIFCHLMRAYDRNKVLEKLCHVMFVTLLLL